MVKFLKLFLPVLVIALGVLSFYWLTATKPETPSRPSVERVWTVETVRVTCEDVRPSLTWFGEVVAGREVALRAHVAGPVMADLAIGFQLFELGVTEGEIHIGRRLGHGLPLG